MPATTPDSSFLNAMRAETEARARRAEPIASDHRGAPDDVAVRVRQAADGVTGEVVALARDLHAHPETGFSEERSVGAIAELLQAHGIAAEVGVFGLDTALCARSGSAGPVVAILAEYDALPGVGHACGHNIIAATAVGAFIALAGSSVPGRVILLGTPAEEGGSGKEIMARAGAFDGVDVAIMLHPFGYDVAEQPFLGRRQVEITFEGIAAHASAQPYMGRNALDAAALCYQGVAMLRQHIPPSDRLHGVIVDGGQVPNVVPERAMSRWYLRSAAPATLRDLSARVTAIAEGAALMTGCGVSLRWDPQPFTLPIRHNRTLVARWAQHQKAQGRISLPPGVVPESLAASTDFGNVSMRIPGIHPMIAVSEPEIALHTKEFAAAAGSSAADSAVRDGTIGLALTAADYLSDQDLRDDVAAEFAAGGALDVARYFD
ncbi:MAG TPA: M20 family metallopeptidase [Mycobacteriales bacterium]|nr:M20 family metallopeptidase [Mycobacteriales bacterium]